MGVLYARVGGAWVPVGVPGPQGPAGAIGYGRAFNANLSNGGSPLSNVKNNLRPASIFINDGFTYNTGTLVLSVNAPGRFLLQANVTIVNGTANNWTIFGIEVWRSGSVVATYEIVGSNVTAGYRAYSVAATSDLLANDQIRVTMNPDTTGASVDGRSWLSISEVAGRTA